MSRKHSSVEVNLTDLPDSAVKAGLLPIFERIKDALEVVGDSLTEELGVVRVVRHNVPPTSPATAASLPAASARLLGQMLQLDKDGVSDDTLHICIKMTGGSYAWKSFTLV